MNKLEKLLSPAPCDFHDEIEYEGKKLKHVYIAKKDGKLWPGSTTIIEQWGGEKTRIFTASAAKKAVMELGYFDKKIWTPDGYIPASEAEIKSGTKHFASIFRKIKKMKGREFYDFLFQAKGAFARHKKGSGESGTLGHKYIENFVCGRPQPKELVALIKKDDKARNSIKAFDKWRKAHKVEWLASELIVGSAIYEFGAIIDVVAYVDAVPSIVEVKTSDRISPDYFVQTAAQQIALEEMGLKTLQRIILRIPKDGGEPETLTLPNNLENGNRLELDKSIFIGLRQVQRGDSYYNNLNHSVKDENGKVKIDIKVEASKVK